MAKLVLSYRGAALLVAALAANVSAQSQAASGNWANLSQLAAGSEIRVSLSGGRTLRGFQQKVTADSLVINATTSQETLQRTEIRRVEVKRNGHRGRNALIGLAIGTGGGLAIGAGIDHGDRGWFSDFGKAVFTPLGAIIGTVVGVAIPSGGWRQVYRAP